MSPRPLVSVSRHLPTRRRFGVRWHAPPSMCSGGRGVADHVLPNDPPDTSSRCPGWCRKSPGVHASPTRVPLVISHTPVGPPQSVLLHRPVLTRPAPTLLYRCVTVRPTPTVSPLYRSVPDGTTLTHPPLSMCRRLVDVSGPGTTCVILNNGFPSPDPGSGVRKRYKRFFRQRIRRWIRLARGRKAPKSAGGPTHAPVAASPGPRAACLTLR